MRSGIIGWCCCSGGWDIEYRWCFVEIVEAVVALGLIIVRTLATAIAMIR